MITELTNRAVNEGIPATIEEALELDKRYSTAELCAEADKIRRKWCGDKIHTCSIVNARSGKCSEDCKWCAQSGRHNTGVREYEYIPHEDAVKAFEDNKRNGAKCFSMVTSGRKVKAHEMMNFCRTYKELSERGGVGLCASMGLLSSEQLQQLWDAGVRKYHCNLETSPRYFAELCTTHTIEDKLETIRKAKEIGFAVCSGGIIGMGETLRDRLEMTELAREAGADSIPVNILQPIKGTPLENVEPISEDEIARSVALMRFVAPKCTLHFAGGRARLSKESTTGILRGGINGALIGNMLTTIGNKVDEDMELFKSAGYEL